MELIKLNTEQNRKVINPISIATAEVHENGSNGWVIDVLYVNGKVDHFIYDDETDADIDFDYITTCLTSIMK